MVSGITAEAAAFMRAHLTSIEELEVLGVLVGGRARAWTAVEIAKELGSAPESIAKRLAAFAALGVVVMAADGSARFAPATADLETLIHEVVTAYRSHRIAVTNLIYAKPTDQARLFADSFRLRKDHDQP